IGQCARRRWGGQRAERRPREHHKRTAGQRTWPRRAILGRHRPERGHRAQGSGECARQRYAQYAEQADPPEHERSARWLEAALAEVGVQALAKGALGAGGGGGGVGTRAVPGGLVETTVPRRAAAPAGRALPMYAPPHLSLIWTELERQRCLLM